MTRRIVLSKYAEDMTDKGRHQTCDEHKVVPARAIDLMPGLPPPTLTAICTRTAHSSGKHYDAVTQTWWDATDDVSSQT